MNDRRAEFEEQIVALFNEIREQQLAMGYDNGSPATVEALCWRHPDGRYGVAQVESAWWGWRAALGVPMGLLKKGNT